ncbi:MAG TPA: hypothetical protein ACQGQH_06315 [Xylella sp.]
MRELNQVEVEQVSGACLTSIFNSLLALFGISVKPATSTTTATSTTPATSNLATAASSFISNILGIFK